MKIIYTAEPIEGIVEFAHPAVKTRLAKEKLKAIIEDSLMPRGLVTSYTITDDGAFPFPFEMPNVMSINGFFGENPDYNEVNKEVNELYVQPQREFKEFETKLRSDLEKATDEQILEMVERFHYAPKGTRERYEQAVVKVGELWKKYIRIGEIPTNPEHNYERGELARVLTIIDDCHAHSLIDDIQQTKVLLQSGERDGAIKKVMGNYSDWRRKNLAHLYNACGDAKFYGAGFFIARLVSPPEEIKTVTNALKRMQMPYQVIVC